MFKCEKLGEVRFGFELEDILKLKGIDNIKEFLNPSENNCESPHLYDCIEEAADCLIGYLKNGDDISLVVDSDADGNTSASLMYQYIKRISPETKIIPYIHNAKQHGLADVVDRIAFDTSKLVIVPDAGSENASEAARLLSIGKEVLVLDHHLIDASNNPAIVINNQLSPHVTDKAITGVGVVYKFCKILDEKLQRNIADDYLDLVAVGCIGDRASMMNLECRYLVLKGIEQIKNGFSKNKFIKTLVDAQSYSMGNKITINNIGFYICPLINSMIRLGEYEDKVLMFEAMCNSDKILPRKVRGKGMVDMSVQEYVLKSCESTVRKQRKITEESADALKEQIDTYGLNNFPILVVNAGENVDSNSTGLIANRLAGQYGKPCLLLRKYGKNCSGSARGSDKCSITNLNQWCKDTGLFTKVAGHAQAFGVSIPFENTNKLFQLLSEMPEINDVIYHVYNSYNADNIHSQIVKNIAKYDYIWGNDIDEPIFEITGIPVNKYNLNLLGSRENKIQFDYHNMKFIKMTKGSSLADEYKEMISLGENIEIDMVCRFSTEGKNKQAVIIIDDWMCRKSDKVGGFGF